MGTKRDLQNRVKNERKDSKTLRECIESVRRWIFQDGRAPGGTTVKKSLLAQTSVTTTQVREALTYITRMLMLLFQSAFSVRFGDLGRNVYELFVPDLLHEFELGVWKATFTHLIRVLIAHGHDAVQTLDKRYVYDTYHDRLSFLCTVLPGTQWCRLLAGTPCGALVPTSLR